MKNKTSTVPFFIVHYFPTLSLSVKICHSLTLSWCFHVCPSLIRSVQVYPGFSQSVLVCPNLSRFVLIFFGLSGSVLVCLGYSISSGILCSLWVSCLLLDYSFLFCSLLLSTLICQCLLVSSCLNLPSFVISFLLTCSLLGSLGLFWFFLNIYLSFLVPLVSGSLVGLSFTLSIQFIHDSLLITMVWLTVLLHSNVSFVLQGGCQKQCLKLDFNLKCT